MKRVFLDLEIFNKALEAWMAETYPEKTPSSGNGRAARVGKKAYERFEFWLFNQGAIIYRINRRECLGFENPALAVVFKLRYG